MNLHKLTSDYTRVGQAIGEPIFGSPFPKYDVYVNKSAGYWGYKDLDTDGFWSHKWLGRDNNPGLFKSFWKSVVNLVEPILDAHLNDPSISPNSKR